MKLLKKINNNFAVAIDSNGEQLIVEGRGIGFGKFPRKINDLSAISHSYYDAKENDVALLLDLSPEILEVSTKIFDYAQAHIKAQLNTHLTLTMADHLQFAIERKKNDIRFDMPLADEIRQLYTDEYKVAEYALTLVKNELFEDLDSSEIVGIAMNIINSEVDSGGKRSQKRDLINGCIRAVEQSMNISIDRNSFNYSRFVTHLQYLIDRLSENAKQSKPESNSLYEALKIRYPAESDAADTIEHYLRRHKYILNEEEKLYLILHINRMCSREDCNH